MGRSCSCAAVELEAREQMKKKIPTKKYKDIARIDQEDKRTYGWYVRVRFQGETHCKFFSDQKSGGRQVALLAAISWRNAKERELGKPRTDRQIVTVTAGNTGVVGVIFESTRDRYIATWVTPDGKQGQTSVSIKKHGREKAFELAKQIRAEKEKIRFSATKSKRIKKIPVFASEKDERKFWQTHDSTEYVDWSKANKATFPNLKSDNKL